MNTEEVLKLAKLARVGISDKEAESLSHEFEAILKYVGEIKEVESLKVSKVIKSSQDYPLRNIMRGDESPHESGLYTEAILNNAPVKKGNYIAVKKIL